MRPACVPRPPAEEVSARTFTPAHCCQVGCSTLEVQAALWKPTTSNAFTLFQSSEAVRARTAAAGVPFAEMSKLVSKLWDEAKRNGTASPFQVCLFVCLCTMCNKASACISRTFLSVCVLVCMGEQVQAIEEKQAVMQEIEKWKAFLADWLGSRQTAPVPAASREHLKQQPVVKKPRKTPSGPPRQTLAKSTRTRDEEEDEPMIKLKKREKKRQSLERLLAAERKFFEDRITEVEVFETTPEG